MVILIDCGFDGGIILILMDSVVRSFDDGINGDTNWFGRPWFRRQLMVLIDSVVRGFGGRIDGDIDCL